MPDLKVGFQQFVIAGLIAVSVPAQAGEFDISQLLESRAACRLLGRLDMVEKLSSAPLYQPQDGVCQAVQPGASGQYFSDPDCSKPIDYENLSLSRFCRETLDKSRFGNGADTVSGIWRQHPGLALKMGVEKLKGLHKPYETRVVYKQTHSDRGDCQLEMRIYKRQPGKTGEAPLIMFHGGSWQTRSSGMLGLQSEVAHYTEVGFTVFLPFYRLTGEVDGNRECNGARGEDILSDASDALDWVRQHAGEYGARLVGGKVLVAGQSAGGHLAAWLTIHHPEQVAGAFLMYPPTDFADLLSRAKAGQSTKGLAAFTAFIGRSPDQASVDLPIIVTNTLPMLALGLPQPPPVYLLHGAADTLVPLEQSVRLCNALAGDPDNGPASDIQFPDGVSEATIVCDPGSSSQLHIIKQAEHALDYCVDVPLAGGGCPTGPKASRRAARSALRQAREWLLSIRDAADTATSSTSGERETPPPQATSEQRSGGGGVLGILWLALPLLRQVMRDPTTTSLGRRTVDERWISGRRPSFHHRWYQSFSERR